MLHRPLILILLSTIGGIFWNHHLSLDIHIATPVLGAGIALLIIAHVKSSGRIEYISLALLFFAVGTFMSLPKKPDPFLHSLLVQQKRVVFEGTLLEPVHLQKGIGRLSVMVQRVMVESCPRSVNWKVRVTVYDNVPSLRPGEKVRFASIPRGFHNFSNPGCYDYETAMKLKGFVFAASVSDGRRIVPMGKGVLPWPRAMVEWIRRPIRHFLRNTLSDQDMALFSALVLGERHLITQDMQEAFSRTGLSHILAVSGLHIGLVAWFSFFIIRGLLSLSYHMNLYTDIRKVAALLTCIPIGVYVSLSGYQISATRAMIMAFAFLWSLILGREKEIWSTLCLSALVILSIQPEAMFQISFQLSFTAVVGLVWLCPPVMRKVSAWLEERLRDAPQMVKTSCFHLASLLLITAVATFFLLPLTTYYFHRISLVSLPANLVAVPILGLCVIPSGLLSALLCLMWPDLARAALFLGTGGMHAIMWIVRVLGQIPHASIWVPTPNTLEMGMFYGAILCMTFMWKSPLARVGLLALCVAFAADAAYWINRVHFNKELRVSFLNVGQGNCALIEFPMGKKMIIDGGGFYRDQFDVGKMVVAPFLWSQKISKIDYMVLTHPQADHMNGLRFIAKVFNPEAFWYNGDWVSEPSFLDLMDIITNKNIPIVIPASKGNGYIISGVSVNMMHLVSEDFPSPQADTLNNRSLLVKLRYGPYSILFPGDIEKGAEKILAQNEKHGLRSDLLLSPHHGSRTSSSEIFLQAVKPRICVISCRGRGRFGFPHTETLNRLSKLGCRVFRTDQHGMVRCTIKGNLLEIGTFSSGFRPIYRLTFPN